jgi:hypothetical protein
MQFQSHLLTIEKFSLEMVIASLSLPVPLTRVVKYPIETALVGTDALGCELLALK